MNPVELTTTTKYRLAMYKTLFFTLAVLALSSCTDSEERESAGRSDGYAVGYNTTCEIRATLVEGDWDDPDYSRGYNEGYAEGARACLRSRQTD